MLCVLLLRALPVLVLLRVQGQGVVEELSQQHGVEGAYGGA
jgi:hypothetical protein